MQPTSLYGRGGPYGVDDRDLWVSRRGIVSMESLAPPKPISREDPRASAAEHPSLSRTVRNRLSQAFSRFTLDPQPPPPPPIQQNGGDRGVWEYHTVTLARVSGYGFGIAVGGGKDSPNGGDPSIGISDVLKAGPAEGKLQINDRLVSANGISLENVDYTRAVQVLRECGNSVTLVIKRKVNSSTCSTHPQSVKVTLTKNKKKDDFGIVLGCRIYVKEIANQSNIDKDGTVQEGDIILKINSTSTDNMTLKEARKMIENSKEKLQLVLKRETATNSSSNGNDLSSSPQPNSIDGSGDQNQWSQQNLYVQPPSRGDSNSKIIPPLIEDKNKFQSGRNRGPLMDISLSQLDQPATPLLTGHSHSRAPIGLDEDSVQRPPLPRIDEFSRNQFDDDPLARRNKTVQSEPRLISFQKEGSVGIRLTGGNEVGVFVTAVQPGSPASLQGLQPGDKLLKVNEMDMTGVTREEAVLFLLHIQDYVNLIVQHMKDDYDEIVANQKGDSFYIRTHFSYEGSGKGELEFHAGEVFHVINTLHNGVVGSWLVYRMGRSNQETQKGVIPNSQRAEQWMAEQQSQAKKDAASESRGSFFKRRSARRSKSLSKDHWEDVVFADGISKFPAYEKVTLKHPGFIRPVILFGALADVARDKLLKDYPDKYASPQLDGRLNDVSKSQKSSGIIRLSAIKEIFDKGKHALLEITPSAVERLNYAQLWPVVVLLRLESKQLLKELRPRHRSSKKLLERANKIEKMWPHLFTSTITVTSADMWYKKLRETIDKQQQQAIWISETKPEAGISDDFLFPMPSRLSYASSPESDLEATSDGRLREGLVKASSDPSIAPEPSSAPPPAYDYGHRSRQLPYDFLQQTDSLGSDLRDPVSPAKCNPGGETVKSSGGGQREPPPLVNRGTKPAHYRTAQERLFARHSLLIESSREQREPPDYINTGAQPHSLERPNGRLGGFDSSSYSSDSYNQYSSNPNDKNRAEPYARTPHDPYRYARGAVQQQPQPQPPKPINMDRGRMPPPTKYRHPDDRPAPPSPPPKPASYQHRLSDGRPVPPPKPGHYQSSRPWRGEEDLQPPPPHLPEPPPYTPNQRSRNSMDFIGSPPYYSPPTADDSANRRYNKPPDDGGRGYAPWPATNGGGPYHNVPVMRGRRDPLFPPPYDHHAPPPSSGLIDLSNRENRGSAFELYKKPLHTMGGK